MGEKRQMEVKMTYKYHIKVPNVDDPLIYEYDRNLGL